LRLAPTSPYPPRYPSTSPNRLTPGCLIYNRIVSRKQTE
jgi:hypothetical protein